MSVNLVLNHSLARLRRLLAVVLMCVSLTTGCVALSRAGDASPSIKILVTYHSLSGNTERMADAVVAGAESVSGTQVVLKVWAT
ncbi:MAG: hypothetical protein HC801_06845 [Nitrospira sp.]|nr:hypothetical protein [Nitrospira sp.]